MKDMSDRQNTDTFLTLKSRSRVNLKFKDSRFIGSASPCRGREEAEEFIGDINEKFSDANHNAYAFRIFKGEELREFSDDDGEPSSSAGPPILQHLQGKKISNAAVVVTRYFGGTKLGIGGLIRAYGNTAGEVISRAEKERLALFYDFVCRGEYDQLGNTLAQLEKSMAIIQNQGYKSGQFVVSARIEERKWNELKKGLRKTTGDGVEMEIKTSGFFPID